MRYTEGMNGRLCRRAGFFLFLLAFFSVVMACGSTLGYSVVLWNDSENQLQDGTIVRVYIRSNISHVYVIGLPESNKKVEIPLWMLTEPTNMKKAKRIAARYAEYEHTYASVKLDGLPIRAEAVNTSKQVYRLREKEIIRVLYKGKGQAVTNGKGNMQGEWLRVLTSGGTQGWCFSYNLDLFQADAQGLSQNKNSDSVVEKADTLLDAVITKAWYPEQYLDMIQNKRIDPSRMDATYGFGIATDYQTIRLALQSTSLSWKYSGIEKASDKVYHFAETPVTMTVRNENEIAVQFTDNDGIIKSQNFVALSENISALLQEEINRRSKELEQLRLFGPSFSSSNYGKLSFREGNLFTWSGYNLLVPSIIAKSAKGNGTVSVNYFISSSLKTSYDGILTFRFNEMAKEVNFLYKMTGDGLRLEDATQAQISNGVVVSRSSSPLVIFFAHDTGR